MYSDHLNIMQISTLGALAKNAKGTIITDLNSAASQANQTGIEMMCSRKFH